MNWYNRLRLEHIYNTKENVCEFYFVHQDDTTTMNWPLSISDIVCWIFAFIQMINTDLAPPYVKDKVDCNIYDINNIDVRLYFSEVFATFHNIEWAR